MTKYVYLFQEGNKDMKDLLGGKGANLAEMMKIGLPVPNGFTVTTKACNQYYREAEQISEEVKKQIFEAIDQLTNITGKTFGSVQNPLLVSVRSGSRASMPGMMDTILNLGLNDAIVASLVQSASNPRFIYDSYRRLIAMFADVVKGYPKEFFENILEAKKKERGVTSDADLTAEDMAFITEEYKKTYLAMANAPFPQDPKEQLLEAVGAVFRSWMNERAKVYRTLNHIPEEWGTAVNIQEMVYGNRGENCGTGVAFTRNPATGENVLYGEYLMNAQGEDVVAGIRTPQPIATLASVMPEVYKQLVSTAKLLEEHYKDMQDMEFTIENGKLYMLQTRIGKRTAAAAIRIAVDMVTEKKITKADALLRVEPTMLEQLLHPIFDESSLKEAKAIAKGLAASPGAACGKICFHAHDVKKEEAMILVRMDTSPEDIKGMQNAAGILTIRGGMTSHAAVVARGMGRCCVCGCENLLVNTENKTLTLEDGTVLKEGDFISLDGTTGMVYAGKIETKLPEIKGDFETFMSWADTIRTLGVRANADNEKDAAVARKFGAEGIGLCRTEHMFFDEDRILAVRQMIVAQTDEVRREALKKLLPMQRADFEKLFTVMDGYTVTIRYLDPPLHEFLPKTEAEIETLAPTLGLSVDALKEQVESLKEFNPMMGHRGCRLGITYPDITRMQTQAVIEAAILVAKVGKTVKPEIMIPLVGDLNEFQYMKRIVDEVAQAVMQKEGQRVEYKVGTMIEVPRACIVADKIAKEAEFFSFGTNDLTQLTYGFSRDDASKFLTDYYDKGIFTKDPFASIDQNGVGVLLDIGARKGRVIRPDIHLGICGEHGGDPESIAFCHQVGLDYVSCSPYRVPIARLAAARAALENKTAI